MAFARVTHKPRKRNTYIIKYYPLSGFKIGKSQSPQLDASFLLRCIPQLHEGMTYPLMCAAHVLEGIAALRRDMTIEEYRLKRGWRKEFTENLPIFPKEIKLHFENWKNSGKVEIDIP